MATLPNSQSPIPNPSAVKLLAIVGPTASGKTALAIELAKKLDGEIICADSRTIYKGLDVGTAKPTQLEQDNVPHFGLDLIEPYEQFSAADFQTYANQKIADIKRRKHLPILVGGSGLYIDGVLYGYKFGEPADPILRAELEELSIEELQRRIEAAGYEMPDNNLNKRYLIRAIEQGGVNRGQTGLLSGALIIGLDPSIEILEKRISERAQKMIDEGILEEVRLIDEEYGWDAPGASGNAYQALRPYLDHTMEIEKCLERFILLDRQLAKRQFSWFKRSKDIAWFDDPKKAYDFVLSRDTI